MISKTCSITASAKALAVTHTHLQTNDSVPIKADRLNARLPSIPSQPKSPNSKQTSLAPYHHHHHHLPRNTPPNENPRNHTSQYKNSHHRPLHGKADKQAARMGYVQQGRKLGLLESV